MPRPRKTTIGLVEKAKTISYMTRDEIEQFFSVISRRRDRALMLVAYRHGLRASEIGMLQRCDVDFRGKKLKIHRVKGSLSGIHSLHSDEVKALEVYLTSRRDNSSALFLSQRGNGISRKQLHVLTNHYGELAGLPATKRHFHVIRHSLGIHLLEGGASLASVQQWLGHTRIDMVAIYAILLASDEEKALSVLAELPSLPTVISPRMPPGNSPLSFPL
jgi:type 1 fimbriae regulatory protein FimB